MERQEKSLDKAYELMKNSNPVVIPRNHKVEEALKHLERETLIQKNGEAYVFLTNEEQEITTHIKQMPVEPAEITNQIATLIFDGILTDKKYQYGAFNGRYAFAFNQYVDEKLYKQGQNHEIFNPGQ